MVATHHHSCTLCEATCGITVTTDGDRVVDLRGDERDPISRGYICPKATALADLHHDPDRLKRPLVKRDGEFVEVSWREAFDLVGDRLRAIRAQYGQHSLGVVVIDPRRSETAAVAEHVLIRPGTDALMLLSLVNVLFEENLVRPGRLGEHLAGTRALRAAAAGYPPERTTGVTGVAPATVRELARALASTGRAVLYARTGACTQEFGGLATWLVLGINALTGHLDEPGGAMFTTPAIDPVPLAKTIGQTGSFAAYRSRVRGLPEFGGELPAVTMAEEIQTPGDGQIRAMITVAGNPVLSVPNGRRLDQALDQLEFMVSVDPYLNETTRPGVRLGVASKHAGASINDVTDERFVDELTGTAALSGQRVNVRAAAGSAEM